MEGHRSSSLSISATEKSAHCFRSTSLYFPPKSGVLVTGGAAFRHHSSIMTPFSTSFVPRVIILGNSSVEICCWRRHAVCLRPLSHRHIYAYNSAKVHAQSHSCLLGHRDCVDTAIGPNLTTVQVSVLERRQCVLFM